MRRLYFGKRKAVRNGAFTAYCAQLFFVGHRI